MLQPWVPMSNTPTAMVLIHNMSNFLSVFWASIFHCFLMRFHHISLLFNAKSITEVKWQRTEQIEIEREEGWDGRQSAMKDMAAAVIFSYQFSEAVIRNISLKIRRKKKSLDAPSNHSNHWKSEGKQTSTSCCACSLSLSHTQAYTHTVSYIGSECQAFSVYIRRIFGDLCKRYLHRISFRGLRTDGLIMFMYPQAGLLTCKEVHPRFINHSIMRD